MTSTTIISFNGHAINDGTVFSAWMALDDDSFGRSSDAVSLAVPGKYPVIVRKQRDGHRFPLHVTIRSGDLRPARDVLNAWFAPGTTGSLVVDFSGEQRTLTCCVTRIMPFDRSGSMYGVMLYAPDPRWWRDSDGCNSIALDVIATGAVNIDDAYRASGIQGDGYQDVKSVGFHRFATNLAPNGGAETNLTGWVTGAGNTLSRSTVRSKFGAASFHCLYDAGVQTCGAMGDPFAPATTTTYSFFAWVYLPTGWTSGDLRLDCTYAGVTMTHVDADGTLLDVWQRAYVKIVTSGTPPGSGTFRLRRLGSTDAGQEIWWDGVQIETRAWPTPYVHTDGGTASRAASRAATRASEFDHEQGWFAAKVRMGFDNMVGAHHEEATVFEWRVDSTHLLRMFYSDTVDRWVVQRIDGAGSDSVTIIAAADWGTENTIIGTWDAAGLRISLNGAAFVSAAGTDIADLSTGDFTLGNSEGITLLFEGEFFWMAGGTGTLTNADAAAFHAEGHAIPDEWPDASGQCFAWDGYGGSYQTGVGLTVYNEGNATDDRPVVRITPLMAKDAGASWIYSREIVLANRVPNAFGDYAICLTDDGAGGGWDHAAEVSAGRSMANGNDVRVLVDGIEVPRWDGGNTTSSFNDTDLKLWANISLSPGLFAELSAAISATATTIPVVPGGTAGWPTRGALLIDDEVCTYTGTTDRAFTGVVRGARSSTADTHSSADVVMWVERRVQMVYGYTSAPAPDPRADRLPMINLDASSNAAHLWPNFASVLPRSMQWARVLTDRNRHQDRILAAGPTPASALAAMALEFRNDGPLAGKPNFNGWRRPVPSGTLAPTAGTYISSTSTIPASMILNVWGVDADGNEALLREQFEASGTVTVVNSSNPYYSIEFEGRGAHVVTGPTSNVVSDTAFTAVGQINHQIFTVPPGLGKPSYISGVSLRLRVTSAGAGTGDYNVRISKYDQDTDTYTSLITQTDKTITASASFAWFFTKFDVPIQVTPGDQLHVTVEFKAVGGGGSQLRWETYAQSHEGETTVKGFRVVSNTLDHSENAVGVDGDAVAIDDVGITYSLTGVPYVALLGQQSIYWLEATLENETSGGSVSFSAPIALGDSVEVDVGERTIHNVTTGENLFSGLSAFVLPDEWLQFDPGANQLVFTDDGATQVLIEPRWRHRWEA